MYLTSEAELKTFIFRRLGSEKHRVDVTDDNWNDIYARNLKYLMEYSSDVVYESFFLIDVGDNVEFTLDSNVMVIRDVREKSGITFGLQPYLGLVSPYYNFLLYGGDDTVGSIYTFMDDRRELNKLMQKRLHFNYNLETKTLRLGKKADEGKIYVNAVLSNDANEVYDNYFFQLLLERDCWEAWHSNTSKFEGSTIGNGVILNTAHFEKKYKELTEEIKEAQSNEEFDFLKPMKL